MKPLTLHRLSIALLTTVLLLAGCIIASQQRDIQRLQARERYAEELRRCLVSNLVYGHVAIPPAGNLGDQMNKDAARCEQINAHLERWLEEETPGK